MESTGEITWIPPYMLTTTCKLVFDFYPFDSQDCEIKFGSWTYSGFKVDIQMSSEDGMDLSEHLCCEQRMGIDWSSGATE